MTIVRSLVLLGFLALALAGCDGGGGGNNPGGDDDDDDDGSTPSVSAVARVFQGATAPAPFALVSGVLPTARGGSRPTRSA